MKCTKFYIPDEFSEKKEFKAEIYSKSKDSKNDYKDVTIELDEECKKIIRKECTCRANSIRLAMNLPQIMCKHIKFAKSIIYTMGYLEEDEEEVITNQKPKE